MKELAARTIKFLSSSFAVGAIGIAIASSMSMASQSIASASESNESAPVIGFSSEGENSYSIIIEEEASSEAKLEVDFKVKETSGNKTTLNEDDIDFTRLVYSVAGLEYDILSGVDSYDYKPLKLSWNRTDDLIKMYVDRTDARNPQGSFLTWNVWTDWRGIELDYSDGTLRSDGSVTLRD